MVISWGLGLWVVYFFIGESATLKLCTTAETGAGLKYICFNTSLKITSGKKAHETHWIINRRGGNYVFFSETLRFQPGAGRRSGLWVLWLVMSDIIPWASPPPTPTMSSVPKHVSDVMQGGPYKKHAIFYFIFLSSCCLVRLSFQIRIVGILKNHLKISCLVALK